MIKDDSERVMSFRQEFEELEQKLALIQEQSDSVQFAVQETSTICDELMAELQLCSDSSFADVSKEDEQELCILNETLDDIIVPHYKGITDLTPTDVTVSIIAGVVASVVDIVFVGTPEVVKLYKGGENFDGSVLTEQLRQVGNKDDKLSEMLNWLSKKCKVPYDISCETGVVCPNNHRLRNFAHDPLMGILFAVVDIMLGTATCIDDYGCLKVLVTNRDYPDSQKILSLVYYLGHLLSDVCTARGLPVPGFILTQFFADGSGDSLAETCEQMYKDGYDLRHFASMSVPVVVKNLIIDIYIKFFQLNDFCGLHTIAEREIEANSKKVLRYKLFLISDAVACSGNVLKFFLPPTAGNPTALNLPEWMSLLRNTIVSLKYQFREKDVEQVLFNRSIINENWEKLLGEL